jgi:hypothetical protein
MKMNKNEKKMFPSSLFIPLQQNKTFLIKKINALFLQNRPLNTDDNYILKIFPGVHYRPNKFRRTVSPNSFPEQISANSFPEQISANKFRRTVSPNKFRRTNFGEQSPRTKVGEVLSKTPG